MLTNEIEFKYNRNRVEISMSCYRWFNSIGLSGDFSIYWWERPRVRSNTSFNIFGHVSSTRWPLVKNCTRVIPILLSHSTLLMYCRLYIFFAVNGRYSYVISRKLAALEWAYRFRKWNLQ